MSVDPLAEKYAYNSTYAFQENKMGLGREMEGLELFGISTLFGVSDAVIMSETGKYIDVTGQVSKSSIGKTAETLTEASNKTPLKQLSSERVKTGSKLEKAENQLEVFQKHRSF